METTLKISRLLGLAESQMAKRGYNIELIQAGSAVEEFGAAVEKSQFTKNMSLSWNDLAEHNSAWVGVRSKSGEPAALLGIRIDCLGKASLADFTRQHYQRLFSVDGAGWPDDWPLPPVMDRIRGRTAFVADMHVAPDHRGKGGVPLRPMVFAAYCLSYLNWGYDWIYAFVRNEHVRQGLTSTYCAAAIPLAIPWSIPPEGRAATDWLLTLSVDDLSYLAQRFLAGTEVL